MLRVQELNDKEQTGREMYRLVQEYSGDINQFQTDNNQRLSDISLPEYYSIVKNIPFRKDSDGVEVLTRPFHLFSTPMRGWDCKKKAIAIASWLEQNNIPYRFSAVSKRPDGEIHHVIVEAENNGDWIPIDATYSENQLGESEPWTNKETLPASGPGTMGSSAKLVSMYGDGEPSENMAAEFMAGIQRLAPEQLAGISIGIASLITGIITAVAGVTAAVVSAVSNKRSQERLIAHQLEQARIQNQAIVEQVQAQTTQSDAGSMPEWLIPIAAIGGALLLL